MKTIRSISSILLLVCSIFLFASWQYRLICWLLIIIINRKWLQTNTHKYVYASLIAVLCLSTFLSLPNYFQRGRTQLHYLNNHGKRVNTPLLPYIMNVAVPEKEAMNLCLKANACIPHDNSDRLLTDAQKDFWQGKISGFYTAYKFNLNCGSFVYGQVCNQVLNTDYDAIYITRPKNYKKDKLYPVVFFCHGYLGSWELYQGILSNLDDCIVVSIGTRKLDGLTFKIDDIFTKYLPYIESLGYQLDITSLHLIGLSNGGSAVNTALKYYDRKFKTITFLSTPCHVFKCSSTKVLLIGGGKDGSSMNFPNAHKKLLSCGTKSKLYFDDKANHFIFAYQQKEITNFLKTNF